MLLSLFRLTMIVSLLISAVCIETNENLPSEKLKAESSERSDALPKEDTDSVHSHDDDSYVHKRQLNKNNGYSDHQSSKIRHRGVSKREHRLFQGVDKDLANKMAKEALKSPQMQDMMRKLSTVPKPHTNAFSPVKLPPLTRITPKNSRSEHKQERLKGRRTKKRKRHHRRYRKEHVGWPKRGSSKRASSTSVHINASAKKVTRRENPSMMQIGGDGDKSSTARSNETVTRINVEDGEYMDFSSPLNTEFSVSSIKSTNYEPSAKLHDNERMIDNLMRTTTRDPRKKYPGDQGIEYSDYYSDDDVLQDIVANKIPIRIVQSRSSNDRYERDAVNAKSLRRVDRNVHPYRTNRVNRRQDFRRNGNAVNRFYRNQRHPKAFGRFAGLNRNSRYLGMGYYAPAYTSNYKLPNDVGYENLDTLYPVSTERVLEQQQAPEQAAVPDASQNREDNGRSNGEIQQSPMEAQSLDQSNYLNQYEVPQGENLKFSVTDQNVEPQPGNTKLLNENPVVEVPQPPINEVGGPVLQNIENYQPVETDLHRVENFDQSMNGQPGMDDPRSSSTKEGIEAQSQSGYSAVQPYGDLYGAQNQAEKEVNNVPRMYGNAAMDQPLGKVLESLGISINTESSTSNQNVNLEHRDEAVKTNGAVPSSDSFGGSEEHVLSPAYMKQEVKEQMNANNDWNHQMNQMNNGNEDRYSKKKASHRDIYDNNYSSDESTLLPTRHMNISIAVQDTKEVATQILDTIMEELEELKLDHSKNGKRDGACRVCQGIDTIAGVWSVARQPQDCRDIQVATSVFNDVFRKTKLSSLREKKNSTKSVTLNHENRNT